MTRLTCHHNKTMRSKTASAGFTMVELLAVVGILAIVGLIAVFLLDACALTCASGSWTVKRSSCTPLLRSRWRSSMPPVGRAGTSPAPTVW